MKPRALFLTGFWIAFALLWAPPNDARAETLTGRAEMNVLARDLPPLMEALLSFSGSVESLGRGVIALNEILGGADPEAALITARSALRRAPPDFNDLRRAFRGLDLTGLRKTRAAPIIDELAEAFEVMPDVGDDLRAHLTRQIEAAERGDIGELAALATQTDDMNLVMTRIQVLLNKAALTMISETHPSFGLNCAYLTIAEAMQDMINADGPPQERLRASAVVASKAGADIRRHISRSQERLAALLTVREKPDYNSRFINGAPLSRLIDDVEEAFRSAYLVELAFAGAFEDVSVALADFADDPTDKAAISRLLEFDRMTVELMARRQGYAVRLVDVVSIFRDEEL